MTGVFGGEQVMELAALAPNAGIDEMREYLLRLHQVVRAREPVAAGDPLSKFVIRGELVDLGLVGYESGEAGTGNATITISSTVISGSSGSSGAADLEVVDATGTAVDLVVGQIKRCTNVATVTATLPSIAGLKRGSVCGVYCTNGLTDNLVDRNGARIASVEQNLTLNDPRWLVLFQLADAAEGWALALWRITL
jgi:hypothetical protein